MEIIITILCVILYSVLHEMKRPFGVIFDTTTGEYIDSATIILINAKTNTEVSRTISSMSGRYAFFVPKGDYRIQVERTHFSFIPRWNLHTMIYGANYRGEVIHRYRDSVISVPIAMTQTGQDWNHTNKLATGKNTAGRTLLFRKLCLFFALLTVIGSISLAVDGFSYLDIILCAVSVGWWGLFLFEHLPVIGQIRFKNGKPTPGYIDVVGYNGILIKRIPTTDRGRYWSLIPSGVYTLYIYAKSLGANNPTLLKSIPNVECRRGILNKVFFV